LAPEPLLELFVLDHGRGGRLSSSANKKNVTKNV
jgi:hypothetical protein